MSGAAFVVAKKRVLYFGKSEITIIFATNIDYVIVPIYLPLLKIKSIIVYVVDHLHGASAFRNRLYRLAHLDTRAAVGSLAQPHHRRVGVIVWPAVSEHRAQH